jgi:hypothetical protein
LYLHPFDKTKEHKFILVNSPEEQDAAIEKGYKVEPHVPVAAPEDSFEETAYEGNGVPVELDPKVDETPGEVSGEESTEAV